MSIVTESLVKTKAASYALQDIDEATIAKVLGDFAQNLRDHSAQILLANQQDLARMDQSDPLYDRLLLTEERINAIADDVLAVIQLDSPVDEVIEQRPLDNGADLSRIRVPLGVVSAIYEARPNVTMDIFALCFRTKNACVLRGGSAAEHTNICLLYTSDAADE